MSDHLTVTLIFVLSSLFALAMLAAMWGVVYNYAAEPVYPCPCPKITLSDGIQQLPGIKITFIVFVVLLGIATIPIVLAVIYYTIDNEAHALLLKQWSKTHWYLNLRLCSWIYVFCALVRIIFLALVPAYDVGNPSTHAIHYGVASTAFALILLGNLMLLLRRWFVLRFLHFKQDYYEEKKRLELEEEKRNPSPYTPLLATTVLEEDKPSFMKNDHDYMKALGIICWVNTVFFLLELACAFIFLGTGDGRSECALTFLIVADMLFQPFDFYFDKDSLRKHALVAPQKT